MYCMRAFLFLLFVLCLCQGRAQYNFSSLDSLLRRNSAALSGKGGGWTTILMKDGKTLYSQSVGDFNPDKPVPIASASKWYAGVLMMRLVDEGKLSLNDKVSTYIPSFKTPEKGAITLGQCFALTSGFPGSSEMLDEFMADSRRQTYAAMVDEIAQTPLVAIPGEQMNYGGLAMQVAGRVAEIATGKSWNTLFEEKVAKPLGLQRTWFLGKATGGVPRIAGGVVSTANDYLKLLQMLAQKGMYGGQRILSEKAVAVLLADQTGKASIGHSPFTKYKKNINTTVHPRYGIGNWVIRIDHVDINTSPGAFGFTPWIDHRHGYYGVIAVRHSFPKVMPVFWEALRLIDKELETKSKMPGSPGKAK
jgi:CubicO group peptidase (beta-lactamase class C family)